MLGLVDSSMLDDPSNDSIVNRLSAPECGNQSQDHHSNNLKKNTLSNSLIDISDGKLEVLEQILFLKFVSFNPFTTGNPLVCY